MGAGETRQPAKIVTSDLTSESSQIQRFDVRGCDCRTALLPPWGMKTTNQEENVRKLVSVLAVLLSLVVLVGFVAAQKAEPSDAQ